MKNFECKNIKNTDTIYNYELDSFEISLCVECNNKLFKKMKEQKELENSVGNWK